MVQEDEATHSIAFGAAAAVDLCAWIPMNVMIL